ncbi:hypothetical protein HK099_007166 [Clydaea vesicula]|uniref:Non-haem dioxygenase N-terminal domain-containing protein n=1 Tax=Clydaea vesicula TaxID=447962 RepID=A0AAD5TX93_9FUNG|nr:hypothetical protein HK099_007166 [Clydaea vesicula]KAJ3377711.1 hypothetical protein HDU92_008037 [Lobulomyces angularis]
MTVNQVTIAQPVLLDYNDLLNPNADLNSLIDKAFGNKTGSLGVCLVKNVPDLPLLRKNLLLLASEFTKLPSQTINKYVHQQSTYSFGWSHGKEIMNGKPDFAKGSYYNNPTYEIPPSSKDPEYVKSNPFYGHQNIWPNQELPQLQPAFMDLGKKIVDVGILLAKHCDKFINKDLSTKKDLITNAIEKSETHKARLLHYFPITPEDVKETSDGGNLDSWCGLHVDHSMLTGLTSAMFVDESIYPFEEKDKSSPEMKDILKTAGLYIKDRDDHYIKVNIPADCLAFQIGEAAQVASNGLFISTPHLVKGASAPFLARNTFAVFMQPNIDYKLNDTTTFLDFTEEVFKRHY